MIIAINDYLPGCRGVEFGNSDLKRLNTSGATPTWNTITDLHTGGTDMAQVINFRSRYFGNLIAAIENAETTQEITALIRDAAYLRDRGYIRNTECESILRFARATRQEKAQKAREGRQSAGTYIYHPEMGEKKPECQIEATLAWYGKHYFLKTDLELKGRGIRKLEDDYIVTKKAFEKLESQYSISICSYLD